MQAGQAPSMQAGQAPSMQACSSSMQTMQSSCRPHNHHADTGMTMQTMQPSCRPCNHHANHTIIMQTMQSPCRPSCRLCNHHADYTTMMQVLLDPLMLQRTLSSTDHVMYKTKAMVLQGTHSLLHKSYSTSCRFGRGARGASSPKSSLIGFLGGCKTTPINSIVDGWVHPAVHLIDH